MAKLLRQLPALFAILSMVPAPALAKKVAVVPAVFVYSDTEQESREASRKLKDFAEKGVDDAQCELVSEDDVRRAIRTVVATSSPASTATSVGDERGRCRDVECLQRLADHLEADEVVFVRVTEFAELDREIEIVLANAPSFKERSGDGFMVMLQEVRRLVVLRLQVSFAKQAEKTGSPASPSRPASREQPFSGGADKEVSGGPSGKPLGDQIGSSIEPSPSPDQGHLLGPLPFSILAGIAVVSGIVWAALDGAVYARYQKLDSGKGGLEYWQKTRDLQVAEWTMVGVTGIAAISAVTLFFLTDFRSSTVRETAARRSLRFSSAPLRGGGFMVLDGRF